MDSVFRVNGSTLARYTGSEARVVVPPGISTIGLRVERYYR